MSEQLTIEQLTETLHLRLRELQDEFDTIQTEYIVNETQIRELEQRRLQMNLRGTDIMALMNGIKETISVMNEALGSSVEG